MMMANAGVLDSVMMGLISLCLATDMPSSKRRKQPSKSATDGIPKSELVMSFSRNLNGAKLCSRLRNSVAVGIVSSTKPMVSTLNSQQSYNVTVLPGARQIDISSRQVLFGSPLTREGHKP